MRPWLSVDLAALTANARALARRVAPAGLCCVVKANAYGHGLVPAARAFSEPAAALGVFAPSEAFALREAGITGRILVLGPVANDELKRAAALGLECAVVSRTDVLRYAPHALRVHIKVDTGIARFGVALAEAERTLDKCVASGLQVVGIYSHLANAEDLDRAFTFEQLQRLNSIGTAHVPGVSRHIAASAAAMVWPQTRLDMVRCGIALYGRWPSPEVQAAVGGELTLTPALRWFAPIVQLREIGPSDPVGYGCTFVPGRRSVIAILLAGYVDGLPRAVAHHQLSVSVRGQRAPLVGRVCMNACFVDVTDVKPQPIVGDVVEFDVEDVASAAGTINYEILACLPPALERRYQ